MLKTLRAVDFRCFSGLALEIPPAGAVFTGDNAQGKTSILEAVCVLVRLHSPRTRRMPALTRIGTAAGAGFGIAGEAWGMERRVRWQTGGLQLAADGEERDGPGAYLADGGLLVWMGNEDLDLVRGSAEGRRRYLDFIGSQIETGYRSALARYRRALKAKNLLLKDPRPREDEIRSYEEVMIVEGDLLVAARDRIVAQLFPRAAAAQRQVSGRDEILEVEYRPAGGHCLRAAMEQARERERRQRQSFVGPHRDDLLLSINGLAAAEFASEGQQRTLALALKLAQGETLAAARDSLPVYLIDDVFGELDPGRRNAVLHALPAKAQKWITTTHLGWLEEAHGLTGMARYNVRAGDVAGVPLS